MVSSQVIVLGIMVFGLLVLTWIILEIRRNPEAFNEKTKR